MFIPFKDNSTAKPKSNPAWKFAFNLWNVLPTLFRGIYHQRSRVECIFSALKKRWGDNLYSKKAFIRRREMALRFIAYNIRLIIFLECSAKHNLPLWVRA
ncbi:MAG: transposase [Nanoarchaeota archaeon]|nr:transposase [Nanoarchaeota archaeon]